MRKCVVFFSMIGLFFLLLATCSNETPPYVPHADDDTDEVFISAVHLSDWSDYEIVVNGYGLPRYVSYHKIAWDSDCHAIYVPLFHIVSAPGRLGGIFIFPQLIEMGYLTRLYRYADLTGVGYDTKISLTIDQEFVIDGRNGRITYFFPFDAFYVDGESVATFDMPTFTIDGILYVPLQFFTDIFGIRNAYYKNGTVFIYD